MPQTITNKIEKPKTLEVLDFYKKNYPEAQTVVCGDCKELLAIEVLIPKRKVKNSMRHWRGYEVFPIGEKLLGVRKRIDGQMGYRCACGNVSVLAEPEKQTFGNESRLRDEAPHEVEETKQNMIKQGYQPNVVSDGNKTTVDNFITERIK